MKAKCMYGISSFVAILLIGCNSGNIYPPSAHIGMFDFYQGYRNGMLPAGESNYTGFWRTGDKAQVQVEGYYDNGFPTGVWKMYFPSGIVESQIIYNEKNLYQSIINYPDGMPRAISCGVYEISSTGIQHRPQITLSYLPTGELLNQDNIPSSNREITITYGKDAICYGYLEWNHNNRYKLWYYLMPEYQSVGLPICKGLIEGSFDNEKGFLSVDSTSQYLGDSQIKCEKEGLFLQIYNSKYEEPFRLFAPKK